MSFSNYFMNPILVILSPEVTQDVICYLVYITEFPGILSLFLDKTSPVIWLWEQQYYEYLLEMFYQYLWYYLTNLNTVRPW